MMTKLPWSSPDEREKEEQEEEVIRNVYAYVMLPVLSCILALCIFVYSVLKCEA